MEERKEAKNKALADKTTQSKESYKRINREVNRTLRLEKRKYLNSTLTKAEQDSNQHNVRDFYRRIRFFQKGYQPKMLGMKENTGK